MLVHKSDLQSDGNGDYWIQVVGKGVVKYPKTIDFCIEAETGYIFLIDAGGNLHKDANQVMRM